MSPHSGREPVITSRTPPSGAPISYPICSDWLCDDYDYDWETIGPDEEDYPAVKREQEIVYYHEPRGEWREHLRAERDRLSGGDPLWWGKPK